MPVLEDGGRLPYVPSMTKHLRLVAVGDDIAVILPHELHDELDVRAGGTVVVKRTAGGVTLAADREYARSIALAREVMERDREALAILAR